MMNFFCVSCFLCASFYLANAVPVDQNAQRRYDGNDKDMFESVLKEVINDELTKLSSKNGARSRVSTGSNGASIKDQSASDFVSQLESLSRDFPRNQRESFSKEREQPTRDMRDSYRDAPRDFPR